MPKTNNGTNELTVRQRLVWQARKAEAAFQKSTICRMINGDYPSTRQNDRFGAGQAATHGSTTHFQALVHTFSDDSYERSQRNDHSADEARFKQARAMGR